MTADDHMEILNLYGRYSFALDTGDGVLRGSTFAEDGTFATYLSGHQPEHVNGLIARTNEIGNRGHRHLTSNIIIEASDDGAIGQCHVLVLGRHAPYDASTYDEPGNGYTMKTGFYRDTLVKTAQGWRFKTRHLFLDHEADSPFRARRPSTFPTSD
nr:nuclear transport factor 2 family protein [Sinorhizobium mexicanum]